MEAEPECVPIRKTSFAEPPQGMSPEAVAWANIATADRTHNLRWFIGAASGLHRVCPELTLQDLEVQLRQRNMHTHLIAARPTLTGCRLVWPPTQPHREENLEFQCIYSCRPREAALAEVLQHAASYEENWERLTRTGVCTVIAVDEIPLPQVQLLDTDERVLMQKLHHNQVLITATDITLAQHMAELRADWPDMKMCMIGMDTTNGCPIVASFSAAAGNKLVSNVGFMIKHDELQPVYLNIGGEK